jgi:hypothetical protein
MSVIVGATDDLAQCFFEAGKQLRIINPDASANEADLMLKI